MLALLHRHPQFRLVFVAHSVSRAGDAFNAVALVVLVFRLTGSGRGVAATVAFEVAPVLVFGPVAGILADRYPRRRVMIAADLGRAVLVGALAISHSSTATAFGVAFGLSAMALMFNPAASSLVPEVVEADELVTANSALWTTAVAAQVALAPLAGAVIGWFGVGPAFALNAASYVGSALVLARLRAGRQPGDLSRPGWAAVRLGIDAVRSHPLLARLAVVQVLASLSAGATSGLLVVLAAETLRVGPSGFGLLLGAIAVGALLGPALLRRAIRPGHRPWLFGPYAVRGVVDLVLAATSNPLVAGGGLVAYGMSTSTGMIAYQSTVQDQVPATLRGRAFALFDVLWNGARLVSLGAGGLLADAIGIRVVYVAGGLVLLVAAGVGWGARVPTAAGDGRHPG